METLELPVLEELEDDPPPVNFTEEEIDLAAFQLWREASIADVSRNEAAAE